MPKSLISKFCTNIGTKSKYVYGYLFLSELDSKKYCENENFREYINSQIDTKRQLLLSCKILVSIKDLHILETIYGVYYNIILCLSNFDELRYFDLNQTEKICDFNMYCVNSPDYIEYIEKYNYLSYLHLVMYDIKTANYCILSIGYEKNII